jgi:ribose 5-phosphate isomerase
MVPDGEEMKVEIEIEPLTSDEQKWIRKLQRVLNECPSNRMSSFTIGDSNITIYDISADKSESAHNIARNCNDWCNVVEDTGTKLAVIKFPFSVQSTAG